jgi:ankyrin repeat protein
MKLRVFVTAACLAVSVSAQDNSGHESFFQAIRRGDTGAVSRFLDDGIKPGISDKDGVPALMLATLFADVPSVELLLKRGADANQADRDGATALMWAIPDVQKVRVLFDHGANINARASSLGRTPLLIAAGYPGTTSLLELLLARGADLHSKDDTGFTALTIAMRSADVDVVRFLVDKGLDPKADVPANALQAVYARHRPGVLDYLMSRGMKVPSDTLFVSNWQEPELIGRWIDQGADVNARRGTYALTPLLNAASSELSHAQTLQVLLERGADVNAESTEGEKPLDWAIYGGDQAKIALLEQHGATRGQGPRSQLVAAPNREGGVDARLAVSRSVSLLLKSSPPMYQNRRCFTCHHNTLPAEAGRSLGGKASRLMRAWPRKTSRISWPCFARPQPPRCRTSRRRYPAASCCRLGTV